MIFSKSCLLDENPTDDMRRHGSPVVVREDDRLASGRNETAMRPTLAGDAVVERLAHEYGEQSMSLDSGEVGHRPCRGRRQVLAPGVTP